MHDPYDHIEEEPDFDYAKSRKLEMALWILFAVCMIAIAILAATANL